eukprot:14561959-Alexandrium_andersonii.AAC.1
MGVEADMFWPRAYATMPDAPTARSARPASSFEAGDLLGGGGGGAPTWPTSQPPDSLPTVSR